MRTRPVLAWLIISSCHSAGELLTVYLHAAVTVPIQECMPGLESCWHTHWCVCVSSSHGPLHDLTLTVKPLVNYGGTVKNKLNGIKMMIIAWFNRKIDEKSTKRGIFYKWQGEKTLKKINSNNWCTNNQRVPQRITVKCDLKGILYMLVGASSRAINTTFIYICTAQTDLIYSRQLTLISKLKI